MRLWSLHPSLLDRAALVASWREALLAQKVLAGGTKGYTHHPQLVRFRAHPAPDAAIGAFLVALRHEATERGYRFDLTRVTVPTDPDEIVAIPVTEGQLAYELEHLRAKLTQRAPERLALLPEAGIVPAAHPLFRPGPGEVEPWEVR